MSNFDKGDTAEGAACMAERRADFLSSPGPRLTPTSRFVPDLVNAQATQERKHAPGCDFYAAQDAGMERPSGACTCGLSDDADER